MRQRSIFVLGFFECHKHNLRANTLPLAIKTKSVCKFSISCGVFSTTWHRKLVAAGRFEAKKMPEKKQIKLVSSVNLHIRLGQRPKSLAAFA